MFFAVKTTIRSYLPRDNGVKTLTEVSLRIAYLTLPAFLFTMKSGYTSNRPPAIDKNIERFIKQSSWAKAEILHSRKSHETIVAGRFDTY